MSLYNMLQGVNRYAQTAVALLHKPDEITENINLGRIRDAFFEEDGDNYNVRVHTRNGGGNRDSQSDAIQAMRSHPWYSRDNDCSHDNTYADFVFAIPADVVAEINTLINESEGKVTREEFWLPPVDHQERFEAVLEAMKRRANDEPTAS